MNNVFQQRWRKNTLMIDGFSLVEKGPVVRWFGRSQSECQPGQAGLREEADNICLHLSRPFTTLRLIHLLQ